MAEQANVVSTNDLFFSARLKIQWANRHTSQINSFLRQLPDRRLYKVAIERDPSEGIYNVKVSGAEFVPAEFPLLIGDAVHNLRPALDHVATAILGASDNDVYFPFHKERKQFVSCARVRAINEACSGLGDYIISHLEPFKDGRSGLWPLTKLDAIDKHKLIVTVAGLTNLWIARIVDKESECSAEGGVVKVQSGRFTIPFGFANKPEFEGEVKPSFDIFFGQGTFFEGRPVLPRLANLSQAASEAVNAIAEFVRDAGGIVGRNPDHKAAS